MMEVEQFSGLMIEWLRPIHVVEADYLHIYPDYGEKDTYHSNRLAASQ
jgi:hypothetical protein